MTEESSLETLRLISLQLARKLHEIGSRESSLINAKLAEHERLSIAKDDDERSLYRSRIDELDIKLAEAKRQYEIVNRELAEALERGEQLQAEARRTY
jgi:hypothetical protein